METIADMQEELHLAKSEMEKMADRDALTGRVNRRGLDSAIELELKKAIDDKSSLALMLVDVDKFKPFNDNLGHPAGDVCLEEVARLLTGVMHRELDIVTRYGGEEFAIVLPNTDTARTRQVADRIIRDCGDRKCPHGFSEVAKHVTVSGGIDILESETSAKELLQKAEKLLYRAKEQGRNQFVW
jgi:diguanylate cyclase (GGDEF)-like protein